MINRCKKGILELVNENPGKDIYVFSDSKVFLDSIDGLPVKMLEHSDVCHVSENSNPDTHLKSFLDMYVISKASAIYRFQAPEILSTSGWWHPELVVFHFMIKKFDYDTKDNTLLLVRA